MEFFLPPFFAGSPDPASPDQEETFGAESNPTGNPISGGEGYDEIFTSTDSRVDYVVTTTDELLAALSSAESGDVIYVDEMARIDLTDISGGVTVPEGVTLAGNRGERNTIGSAIYSFEVEEAGDYVVWGLASASHEESDSFWISVDGEGTRRWDLEAGSDWRWNREGVHRLSSGQHTLTIHWREKNSKLDGILITDDTDYLPDAAMEEQSGERHTWIEAESGTISSPMEAIADSVALGGAYISAPDGPGMGELPVSPGGRISLASTDSNYPAGLIVGGENVRITGLRIEGPDKDTDWIDEKKIGIYCTHRNFEVDNCEIWGWNGAAITMVGTGGSDMKAGGYIHHNYIHHCQMDGLGYGIVVSAGGVALVEANYFDYCRHAIAGTGVAGDGYEARYNICGPHAIATSPHAFDMHGKPDPNGSGTIAGDTILIHHNTFQATQPTGAYPVAIRGVPRDGAYIDHNWFYYTQQAPVWQTDGRSGITMTDNLIGPERNFHEEGPIRHV
ncbi:right-handed parallel beta-helix repeat-containing protein [Methanoculleus oceani]|uniref:Right handed beta helix domain-containing protein n=1 Tax=Methanoculleus oceani TaxID=2184756 RepID=A0ABD4TDY3_9EURY|nr:right-handed parallel beta-helix repeat-containing protein [Methanoculleus sp. CWC-02]MCM2465684.1 hypothetical protein [Methanoculleus sp. CWC-02]